MLERKANAKRYTKGVEIFPWMSLGTPSNFASRELSFGIENAGYHDRPSFVLVQR